VFANSWENKLARLKPSPPMIIVWWRAIRRSRREILGPHVFDMLVVPVGGGGLAAGQIVARDFMNTSTEIIGAEPQSGNDAARSLRAGKLLSNEQEPLTVADGARTLRLGQLPWEILRRGIADILEAPDALTLEAVRTAFALNLKVEPTGALALGSPRTVRRQAGLLPHQRRQCGPGRLCISAPGVTANVASFWQEARLYKGESKHASR